MGTKKNVKILFFIVIRFNLDFVIMQIRVFKSVIVNCNKFLPRRLLKVDNNQNQKNLKW